MSQIEWSFDRVFALLEESCKMDPYPTSVKGKGSTAYLQILCDTLSARKEFKCPLGVRMISYRLNRVLKDFEEGNLKFNVRQQGPKWLHFQQMARTLLNNKFSQPTSFKDEYENMFDEDEEDEEPMLDESKDEEGEEEKAERESLALQEMLCDVSRSMEGHISQRHKKVVQTILRKHTCSVRGCNCRFTKVELESLFFSQLDICPGCSHTIFKHP